MVREVRNCLGCGKSPQKRFAKPLATGCDLDEAIVRILDDADDAVYVQLYKNTVNNAKWSRT